MSGAPWWQRLVVGAQQEVGGRARAALDRDDVMQALTTVRTAADGVRRATARPMGGLVHLVQLPTDDDVRAMRLQMASLEREVRALRKQVADPEPEPYR